MIKAPQLPNARWLSAMTLAMLFHGAAIALLLVSRPSGVVLPSELPPFAILLAPQATAAPVPPTDLAIGKPHAETADQAGAPPDLQPDLVTTAHGTIQAPPPAPAGPPLSKAVAATSAAAAPPPSAVAPVTPLSAAPVEGASASAAKTLPSWEAQVRARLERAKRYPAGARIMRQQDTVVLAFHVDGNGNVSGVRIKRSAGYEELEGEALALIARVSPLPSPPDGVARQSSVPIEFYLNR